MMWFNVWCVLVLFVCEWVGWLVVVGVLCLSLWYLVCEMVDVVLDGDGLVVEFGGGIGVIIVVLLECGVVFWCFVVVECLLVFV